MLKDDEVLAVQYRRSDEVHFTFSLYKRRGYVNVRCYYDAGGHLGMQPSKKGIMMPIAEWPGFAQRVEEVSGKLAAFLKEQEEEGEELVEGEGDGD